MTFLELLDQLDIPYITEGHEHCREGWAQTDCPRCTKNQQHWRLGINLQWNYGNCWMCGRMSLASLLKDSTTLSWDEIKQHLSGVVKNVAAEKVKVSGRYEEPAGVEELKTAHRTYLTGKRGFKVGRLQNLWEIQGIGSAGTRLDWRIFIPVIYKGKPVSWTTRSIADDPKIRYISAEPYQETYEHKHLLYGEDYVRNGIIIEEGPTDVWNTGPGAVCTFGTDYTAAQVDRMLKYPLRVICFDSKADAQKKARDLFNLLNPFPGTTHNVVLDAADPGSANKREIKQLRKLIGE